MNKPEQTEFIKACEQALLSNTVKRVVFSSSDKDKKKKKSRFDLILGEKKQLVRASNGGTDSQSELNINTLISTFASPEISPFQSATLYTEDFDFHYAENRKGEPRLYKSKASMKGRVQEHNKRKNYVLREDRPYLKGLGMTNRDGKIVKKHYAKFRQIANFVEIIDRDISAFVESADVPISILDLGCGKGYLTFATYDYVRTRSKAEPAGVGIDIKPNVIDLCNALSNELNFTGLKFRNSRIEQDKLDPLDILIALHACDTATDDALALGARSGMKYFFCAPCCQAEIAQQTEASAPAFDLVNTYPLMKRRQADIITDVCRALLLNALGYEVKFLEFTALEHTSKNLMLAGKLNDSVDHKAAYARYQQLKNDYGFKRHSLEENVRDLLKAKV